MGLLISSIRCKPTTIEHLEDLESQIQEIEMQRRWTDRRHNQVNMRLPAFFMVFLFVASLVYLRADRSWPETIFYWTVLLALCILILMVRRMVYSRMHKKDMLKLNHIRSQKKMILEEVMDKNTYKTYRFDPGCPLVSPHCSYNNATHNGNLVPSPTPCNCCELCLVHLVEGEECSLGGFAGASALTSRCGNGLSCQALTGDVATCRKIISRCHEEQNSWDERRENGTLGSMELRPECDGSGDYGPNKCVPGKTCFCQNKNGQRIFGEAVYTDMIMALRMTCACSRLHEDVSTLLQGENRWPVLASKCLSDGSFNPIQCVGDICFCVDRVSGIAAPPTAINVTREELSKLDCFDGRLHSTIANYKTVCEEERQSMVDQHKAFEEDGYIMKLSTIPSCQPDGSFRSLRIEGNRSICVDANAEAIDDYGAEINTPEANTMNCNCARTTHILSMASSTFERPSCCSNGNFRPIQCRRGVCYCVSQDGVQEGQEVEDTSVGSLNCYTQTWRQC